MNDIGAKMRIVRMSTSMLSHVRSCLIICSLVVADPDHHVAIPLLSPVADPVTITYLPPSPHHLNIEFLEKM